MTPLEKNVKRITMGEYSTLYQRKRRIVVMLEPGDFISFREAGRRTKYTATIDGLFKHVIRLKALADATEKRSQGKYKRREK